MKVKVKNKIFDSEKEPVMLIFDNRSDIEGHGNNILNMIEGATKYCVYPENIDIETIKIFMEI